jgi:hypothetical protein
MSLPPIDQVQPVLRVSRNMKFVPGTSPTVWVTPDGTYFDGEGQVIVPVPVNNNVRYASGYLQGEVSMGTNGGPITNETGTQYLLMDDQSDEKWVPLEWPWMTTADRARYLVSRCGMSVASVARTLDVRYQQVYQAVKGGK